MPVTHVTLPVSSSSMPLCGPLAGLGLALWGAVLLGQREVEVCPSVIESPSLSERFLARHLPGISARGDACPR